MYRLVIGTTTKSNPSHTHSTPSHCLLTNGISPRPSQQVQSGRSSPISVHTAQAPAITSHCIVLLLKAITVVTIPFALLVNGVPSSHGPIPTVGKGMLWCGREGGPQTFSNQIVEVKPSTLFYCYLLKITIKNILKS